MRGIQFPARAELASEASTTGASRPERKLRRRKCPRSGSGRSWRVKRLLLVLTMALSVAAGAQTSLQQGPPGAPVRKSPLTDYAGTWTGSFEGKTWLTVKLALQADRLSGSIQHPHDLQFNDQGELKSTSDDQSTEVVQDAQVNPDGLLSSPW